MKYRQINPPVCEAVQWHGAIGSAFHPAIACDQFVGVPGPCGKCGHEMKLHGKISNEGRTDYAICPGDYVLFTTFYYPMRAEDFERNFVTVVNVGNPAEDLRDSAAEITQALENLRARTVDRKPLANLRQETGAAIYSLRLALMWLKEAVEIFSK
jgi:hypothetical protein